MINVALFDIDDTLIQGDSTLLWEIFSAKHNLTDNPNYQLEAHQLIDQYHAGQLNIQDAMRHSLQGLKNRTVEESAVLVQNFVQSELKNRIYPEGVEKIKEHLLLNHDVILISASGEHIVSHIAKLFQVKIYIACLAEIMHNRYTGNMIGVPSFQKGKVVRFKQWASQQDQHIAETWFYSDSLNDLPLLNYVDHPVTVNPSESLKQLAVRKNWPILEWQK